MNVKTQVNAAITVGDQPTVEDLKALKGEGFVGVVNLRNEGEPEQPLGPEAEGTLASSLGLDYLHVGVGSAPLTEDQVASFCSFLDAHATGRTLVHCRKGGRASALVLIYRALKEGWSADETPARGSDEGLNVDGGLRSIVEGYLRGRKASGH